jgi:hypothetical protein
VHLSPITNLQPFHVHFWQNNARELIHPGKKKKIHDEKIYNHIKTG